MNLKRWYCDPCRAVRLRQRGHRRLRVKSTAAGGYGNLHQKDRKRWDGPVAAGTVRCGRGKDCLYAVDGVPALIEPGEPWDLGHKQDRSLPTHPEHRRCNRATARWKKTAQPIDGGFSRVW